MATLSYTKPTVGASTDTWGNTLNSNWDNLAAVLGTVDSTDIQKLEAITATAAELNVLDGVTATTSELNTASTHYVPSGGIIMWKGSVASIPSGWHLCDGNNGTPNLTDRFVVGAGNTYAVDANGGSADAIVVEHTHTYSGTTNTTGAHEHSLYLNASSIDDGPASGGGVRTDSNGVPTTMYNGQKALSAGDHSHTFSGTTASSGSSGTNANLPPYYALAYIMKA